MMTMIRSSDSDREPGEEEAEEAEHNAPISACKAAAPCFGTFTDSPQIGEAFDAALTSLQLLQSTYPIVISK